MTQAKSSVVIASKRRMSNSQHHNVNDQYLYLINIYVYIHSKLILLHKFVLVCIWVQQV